MTNPADPAASGAGRALRSLRKIHEGRPASTTSVATATATFAPRTSDTTRPGAIRTVAYKRMKAETSQSVWFLFASIMGGGVRLESKKFSPHNLDRAVLWVLDLYMSCHAKENIPRPSIHRQHHLEPVLSVEPGLQHSPRTATTPAKEQSVRKRQTEQLMTMQLLTEKQVSAITAIPPGTLRRWRCIGEGPPYIKMGNKPKARVKYDAVDILAYVEAGRRFPSVRATLER